MKKESMSFSSLVTLLQSQRVLSVSGIEESRKLYLLTKFIERWRLGLDLPFKRVVINFSDLKRLHSTRDAILQNCSGLLDDTGVTQVSSIWGANRYSSPHSIKSDRLNFLCFLTNAQNGLFFCHFPSLFHKCAPIEYWKSSQVIYKVGEEYSLDDISLRMKTLGYRQVERVTECGEFAARGGLIDVFSPSYMQGLRLEFLFDKLNEIRIFDPTSGLTISKTNEGLIFPIWDCLQNPEKLYEVAQKTYESLLSQAIDSKDRQSIVDRILAGNWGQEVNLFTPHLLSDHSAYPSDFFTEGDLLIHWENEDKLFANLGSFVGSLRAEWIEDRRNGKPGLDPELFFCDTRRRDSIKFMSSKLELDDVVSIDSSLPYYELKSFPEDMSVLYDKKRFAKSIDFWISYLEKPESSKKRIVILASQIEHSARIQHLLELHKIPFLVLEDSFSSLLLQVSDPGVVISRGVLHQTVWDDEINTFIVPEHILFDESYRERRVRKDLRVSEIAKKFRELSAGSLVVHSDHGIARYSGMRSMSVGGIKTDFLQLEFADKDKLYLPVHRMSLLQRYSGGGDRNGEDVSLDKLRGGNWSKRKERANNQAKFMAEELTKLYAQRVMAKREAFLAQNNDYFQFEADFLYPETPDQQRAIDDINRDLSRDFPMDRLICGDVGFGKTEVALRAAMRVVQSGCQVLVLCPTSILSYQHFQTFKKRFEKFGIVVRLVNRFEKPSSVKESLFGFANGSVDILVGTHRLLSKDVVAKNLGLLVIDEEQKFGVSHKEFIKRMKSSCDFLVMSATPIPRSLHMSLLGLRDISIIATPPLDRLSIKTFVAVYNDDLIRSAILRELQRGGQVFFVHNRVQDILNVADSLGKIVPSARISVAHGQMKEINIEHALIQFVEHKSDVLVCTSIVESGIDIPNVNTIIVNNADFFGISQLYQLRGRVGRSSRQSYAYFITRGLLEESSDSKKRLDLMLKFQDIGSGLQLASYDLELRGAGNLLGGEQSGNVDSVGYELYMDLLEREVAKLNGQALESEVEPEIKLELSASIDSNYVANESERVAIYKSLFSARSVEEIYSVRSELRDQYGQIPHESEALILLAKLRVLLKIMRVVSLHVIQDRCELKFSGLNDVLISHYSQVAKGNGSIYSLTDDFRLVIRLAKFNAGSVALNDLVGVLMPFVLQGA